MAHRARIICVGIGWWVLGVVALCACLQFIWIVAARLGLVQVRVYGGWTEYYGGWADVIGFSGLAAFGGEKGGITLYSRVDYSSVIRRFNPTDAWSGPCCG